MTEHISVIRSMKRLPQQVLVKFFTWTRSRLMRYDGWSLVLSMVKCGQGHEVYKHLSNDLSSGLYISC